MNAMNTHVGSGTTVLACDVGGTNTTFALVEERAGQFSITRRFPFLTRELSAFTDALDKVREALATPGSGTPLAPLAPLAPHAPHALCISGAGPVRENRCHLTNVPWQIDGDAIAARLGLPVRVINDFTAVSYGIPLLDIGDETKIGSLAPAREQPPQPEGIVRAVVGAGTGLGVGYVVDHHHEYIALPSEGGHAPFAPYNEQSRELMAFVSAGEVDSPGAECFVSGQGIKNLLDFYRSTGRIPPESLLNQRKTADPGRHVSEAAHAGDPAAISIMEFFVDNYARVAAAVALHFLPLRGLYLAGGIVTKNEQWFARNDRFLRSFHLSYRENIRGLLHRVPVYVIRDYEVSLYGAAYGATLLLRQDTV